MQTSKQFKRLRVGIIGGGMTGLATAFYLAKNGVHVTVLEKENEVGGLSRSEQIMPGLRWDRFYHVILPTDKELIRFIDEIGLGSDVQFRETRTGFYTNGTLHSLSNIKEFLKFEPLSLLDKIRLGIGIFYTSKIKDWKRLENLYVKAWLIRVFGRSNYEKLWEPLLRSKLGSASHQASAAFIWGCIKRLYDTRHSGSKKELMGVVREGYHSILNHVRDRLLENGASILVNHGVEIVESSDNGRVLVRCSNGKVLKFDRLVMTIPNPQVLRVLPTVAGEFRSRLETVRYLSLICVTLVLSRPLSPFYITNLTDSKFPFTGIIEATNVVPREILGSKSLVYLPKYLPPEDPFLDCSDDQVLEVFIEGVRRIFPDLSDSEIVAQLVHSESYVQPIQDVGYSDNIPSMKTPFENVYLVNTTMIVNSTLNNNEVIKLARKIAEVVLSEQQQHRQPQASTQMFKRGASVA